ncbi:hypothetical protein ACWC10_19730 [Streptomyces sp. NPDC001595]|uniref:hypothetical protein n=1 Tax=Streptomyces sp. NPDC001532 TaxID=3154520 RepID=UPI0033213836
MSKRQIQKMLRLMGSGEPVQLTSAMASVKKLAKLAFVAQQFGYEYADVRQGGANNSSLVMLIVPDPSPHARTRAAQNWAQYPNAGDGVSLPPFVPDALELLKARINFDLTGKSAEKRMAFGAVGVTVGCGVAFVQAGGGDALVWSGLLWVFLMGILAVGFVVTRRRNAKFAARLQAAGFAPVADESGRVRYLPPGGQLPGHGNPFGQQQQQPYQPYQPAFPQQQPYAAAPPSHPQQQPYAPSHPQQQPYPQQPYPPQATPQQQPYPAQATPQQQPYPPQAQSSQQPYPPQAQPSQQPYRPQAQPSQQPYRPYQQPQQPYPPQPPHPQQNPHWQPPGR